MSTHHLYVRRASAGSGKTYTLAAHYIALLLHGESYRSILAVTFTNKATAEMKERIVGYLYAIFRHTSAPETQGFLSRVRAIYGELGWPKEEIASDAVCAARAEQLFLAILSDYDAMRVQTIDAFLQSLLSGMVQMLGGSVGYAVELDLKHVIEEAVDNLLTIGARDAAILQTITRYMDQQMADEKHWDIRRGLNDIGEQLYREQLQQHASQLVLDETRLLTLSERKKNWRNEAVEELSRLRLALEALATFSVDQLKYGQRSYGAVLDRLRLDVAGSDPKREQDKKIFLLSFSDTIREKMLSPELFQKEYKGKGDAEDLRQRLLELDTAARACRRVYLHLFALARFTSDLALMGALRDEIQRMLEENNTRLLATTANTLAEALRPGDADFVLEKAGIRYRHIMLDEFQDTSSLQWDNFRKLLQEILSTERGSTLIVGDIKQSIYRWRNGDWSIMQNLPSEWEGYYNEHTPQLSRNFRSEKEVVQFNLNLFRALSDEEGAHELLLQRDAEIPDIYEEGYPLHPLTDYYRPGHEGGYVHACFFPQTASTRDADTMRAVRRCVVRDMFRRMQTLLDAGVSPSAMMILVRRNQEAKEILAVLEEMRQEEAFASLRPLSLVSGDCFQLRFSPTVNLLVAAIRYIYTDDGVAKAYLQMQGGLDLSEEVFAYRHMALTDMVEEVLSHFLEQRRGEPLTDLAYVNSFRDSLRAYVLGHGSDGRKFLRYWDNKLRTKCIPAVETQGVRMMTIHASKGLQAENVFIPFVDWAMEENRRGSKLWCEVPEFPTEDGRPSMLPIEEDGQMEEAGFEEEYQLDHHLQRIDNLNLLYVAFTRAAERLFISAPLVPTQDSKGKPRAFDALCSGHLVMRYLGLEEQMLSSYNTALMGQEENCVEVSFGSLFWEKENKKSASDEVSVTDPFTFRHAPVEDGKCHTSASRLEFRQSQDSVNYGWDIAAHLTDEPDMDRRAFGTLCHDMLAEIRLYATQQEAKAALHAVAERWFASGRIPSEALRDEALGLTLATVSDERMWPFFSGDWRVLNEESLLLLDEHGEMEERRMDRVLWQGDRAVVIDYKFGHDDVRYDRQVKHYMHICRRMGARTVEGYLWIASEKHLVPVKEK